MKRYLYVQVEIPTDDGPASFSHHFVDAAGESEAYAYGQQHFAVCPTEETRKGFKFLNDYVVEIPATTQS